jgi:hypothetical protein
MWTCHVENSSGFILINSGFQKFNNRRAKLPFDFGNNILNDGN